MDHARLRVARDQGIALSGRSLGGGYPSREGEWDAKPPALVRDLITEGHCHDRGMPLSDSPQSVADEEQVEQLIGWIRDERRRASVVVAAPLTDGSDLGSLERNAVGKTSCVP